MYNKYIFINQNRRKKQKELEEKQKLENSQINIDMLQELQNKKDSKNTKKTISNISNNLTSKGNNQQFSNSKGKKLMKFVDNYVLVDIETTGLSPIKDEIIEIGAIKVENNQIIDSYNQLIKIDRSLSPFITSLTGITNEMLQTGKQPHIVIQEFVNFAGENILIGHNVNFDIGFLTHQSQKYLNHPISNDYIDTMCLARRIVPNSVNYKLATLANLFDISYQGAHRGLKDVEITYEVYNHLRKAVNRDRVF